MIIMLLNYLKSTFSFVSDIVPGTWEREDCALKNRAKHIKKIFNFFLKIIFTIGYDAYKKRKFHIQKRASHIKKKKIKLIYNSEIILTPKDYTYPEMIKKYWSWESISFGCFLKEIKNCLSSNSVWYKRHKPEILSNSFHDHKSWNRNRLCRLF